eukprot:2129080-Rhodomonas_salina.2
MQIARSLYERLGGEHENDDEGCGGRRLSQALTDSGPWPHTLNLCSSAVPSCGAGDDGGVRPGRSAASRARNRGASQRAQRLREGNGERAQRQGDIDRAALPGAGGDRRGAAVGVRGGLRGHGGRAGGAAEERLRSARVCRRANGCVRGASCDGGDGGQAVDRRHAVAVHAGVGVGGRERGGCGRGSDSGGDADGEDH